MCVHEDHDLVSDSIVEYSRLGDCDVLTKLWGQSEMIIGATEQPIYVDVGANIGACVLEMLLTSTAPIVAFEPHPRDQFCLTSTLVALSQEQRDRVSLFPIALGNEKGSGSTIYAAKGNMGNSVVGVVVKDRANRISTQDLYPPIPIQIERLDTNFNTDSDAWNIPLMKMDAQRFECRILDGMGEVYDFLAMVSTELASDWLIGQGYSVRGLLDRLRAASFKTYLKHQGFTRAEELLGEPQEKGLSIVIAKSKKYWYVPN